MPDITLCRPTIKDCPQKDLCYRFTATVTEDSLQSYADFSRTVGPTGVCTMFMPFYRNARSVETTTPTASPRRRLLSEAADIVDGDRNDAYGEPEDSFRAIAALWNAYLEAAPEPAAPLTPADVGVMMMLMKVARLRHSPGHIDSLRDIAGYAACVYECSLGDRP